jgi:cytochrome c2
LRAVFIRILGFVIVIDLFYMSVGQFWLTQTEEHPPAELEIGVDTDTDTLVSMGRTLLGARGGCLLCHKTSEQGNTRGPDLRGVGARAASRVPGMSAQAYLVESLVSPGAYVVEEVAYLQSLGGEVTVEITTEDVAAAAVKKEKPTAAVDTHPGRDLVTRHGCIACHDVNGTIRLVGPPLTNVRERLSAAEIRQSITDPNSVIAEGFPPGLMLQDFAQTVPPEELDQIVSYLSGEVSLSERLAHPAVPLVSLILLFNGGVWIMRRLAISRAVGPGESSA